METSALDYTLPKRLVAQHPLPRREDARLLVLDRQAQSMKEDVFRNLGSYLRSGDCLVTNNTKVIRARLRGQKATGGAVEILVLREIDSSSWIALVRPSGKVRPGARVRITEDVEVTVQEVLPGGRRRVEFHRPDVLAILEKSGELPLPPYIERGETDPTDLTRYQTVYAEKPGAVAAPTAGLHYTESLLASLERQGIRRSELTLHVSYGTFRPVKTKTMEEHSVDAEEYDFPEGTARLLNATREEGGRVVAVGTTSTRVLETVWRDGAFVGGSGMTDRFIYPPYTFGGVDALQTNFHLPRSSLLALTCAFGGTKFVLAAYKFAVRKNFRFFSYGDTMLIV